MDINAENMENYEQMCLDGTYSPMSDDGRVVLTREEWLGDFKMLAPNPGTWVPAFWDKIVIASYGASRAESLIKETLKVTAPKKPMSKKLIGMLEDVAGSIEMTKVVLTEEVSTWQKVVEEEALRIYEQYKQNNFDGMTFDESLLFRLVLQLKLPEGVTDSEDIRK